MDPFTTPRRPVPGEFVNTPAASRFGRPPAFPGFGPTGASQQLQSQPPPANPQQETSSNQTQPTPPPGDIKPIPRAARTINEILQRELNYPDLDSYIRQGISSDYELPSQKLEAAWAPFQRTKLYGLPDRIFEHWNKAEVATSMGLFAELNHAWVIIDNALYLWDYTNPNPDLIGFEEQPNTISTVRLVVPRVGVFVKAITHLLVVATENEIILLGVQAAPSPSGVMTVNLYKTNMHLPTRGIKVQKIEGSTATGRIFYAAGFDNDVYELTYHQEETWFSKPCGRVNHTTPGYNSLMPTIFGSKPTEHIVDMVVDDTRRLLYTLSSKSTIRIFYMDSSTTLHKAIEKKMSELTVLSSHMITTQTASTLLTANTKIASISPISAKEANRLHLMVTTSTGCRLFLSATRGNAFSTEIGAPTSIAVHHIKFPPKLTTTRPTNYQQSEATDLTSEALTNTRTSLRFPPGIFMAFVTKEGRDGEDQLFLSGPDTGRIAAQARDLAATQVTKYYEQATWLGLNSHAEAVGLMTKPFAAAQQPRGFGNELATQFDEPSTEIAILTNSGIHIIRRRRLVDIFAAAIRNGGNEEGFESEVKKFIRQYGRGETTATALAVACGHGSDVIPAAGEPRATRNSEPQTLEYARRCFVEFGGRPSVTDSGVNEGITQPIDTVRPSSRHEGLALYVGRLVRSLWKSSVMTQSVNGTGQVVVSSTVSLLKLQTVQEDLIRLQTFLDQNKSFIEGLAGPDSLQRVSSQQEEIAIQGEHQALYSLQRLIANIIEGISFVQMLFDERVDEIWTPLDDTVKQHCRDLTFEILFASDRGKDLAKVLVKAIVNRNIANGSNVDTVAEALRRRCGNFCSADDVIIFKAQEQLKKASEVGAKTDAGRNLLNESLRLFQQVAKSLTYDNLEKAIQEFSSLQFYAGSITLALLVAHESDPGKYALAWTRDGRPENDTRSSNYNFRKQCYDLVHRTLQLVDEMASREPETIDGKQSVAAAKRNEAYAEVNEADDELFQYGLFDWYLKQGLEDRLLAITNPRVADFLRQEAANNVDRVDLLWKYYVHHMSYHEAATVQLDLARSDYKIALARRINYLTRAKANANTTNIGHGGQTRQILLHEITELLDVGNLQDEVLRRIKADSRIGTSGKAEATERLDGQILPIAIIFNEYVNPGGYFDIQLEIFESVNHNNTADIQSAWQQYIDITHHDAVANGQPPYSLVVNVVRTMFQKLKGSDATFSPQILVPLIETYAFTYQNGVGSPKWVVDLFVAIELPFESVLRLLNDMYLAAMPPFTGNNVRVIAQHMLYVVQEWYQACTSSNSTLFGSNDTAMQISIMLGELIQANNFMDNLRAEAESLKARIERTLR